MYSAALLIHSWLRWIVLIAGVIALFRGLAGWSGRRTWTRVDDRAGFWFTMFLNLQMLLGLLLYFFLSPFTTAALGDFGAAMKNPGLRFWAVEHLFGMVIAIALAHIGQARIRRAAPNRKHRTAAIFFGLALLVLLASIPWPGTANGRELFRF